MRVPNLKLLTAGRASEFRSATCYSMTRQLDRLSSLAHPISGIVRVSPVGCLLFGAVEDYTE